MGVLLHVHNLSAQVTDDDLIVSFGDHGAVESATIDRTSDSITGSQSACIVMSNSEEAQAAIDWLHDTQLKGSTISVTRAPPSEERKFWFHLDLPH